MAAAFGDAIGGQSRSLLWADASGAAVAVVLDADEVTIACVKPTMVTQRRTTVVAKSIIESDSCAYCSLLEVDVVDPADGTVLYPLKIELDDWPAARARVRPGRRYELGLAAFAERVTAWSDIAAYRRSTTERFPLAERSVLPHGTLVCDTLPDAEPRAAAVITGLVELSEERYNRCGGAAFGHLVLDTYGLIIDVLVALHDFPDGLPGPGSVVQGVFWIVGSPALSAAP